MTPADAGNVGRQAARVETVPAYRIPDPCTCEDLVVLGERAMRRRGGDPEQLEAAVRYLLRVVAHDLRGVR